MATSRQRRMRTSRVGPQIFTLIDRSVSSPVVYFPQHARHSLATASQLCAQAMKLSNLTLRIVLAAALVVGVQASAAQAMPPTAAELQDWQTKIAQIPQPSKGCFNASYPKLVWQQTSCSYAQRPPMVPRPPGPLPFTVGGGGMNDLSAKAPTGTINSATGSFDSTTGLTSETSSGTANNYS